MAWEGDGVVTIRHVRQHTNSEGLVAYRSHVIVFCDVTPCSLVTKFRRILLPPLQGNTHFYCFFYKNVSVSKDTVSNGRTQRPEVTSRGGILRFDNQNPRPPTIICEVTPPSHDRYPQQRLLSEERNPVLKHPQ